MASGISLDDVEQEGVFSSSAAPVAWHYISVGLVHGASVAFVGDHGGGGEPVDEFVRMSDIVFLSGTADQPDRIAQGVSSGMDFGTQTTSGAAQSLGMRPPFFRRAPAAC